ncbi:hypothetical protein ACFQYP_12810 [Nonomuraea antimicrobica]
MITAVTTIAVGVATGLGTSAGQKFLGLGENKPPAPIGPPIKITKVTLVPRDTDQTWVFPDPLSEQALDKINGEYAAFKDHDEILRSSGAVETGVSTVEVEVEETAPRTYGSLTSPSSRDARRHYAARSSTSRRKERPRPFRSATTSTEAPRSGNIRKRPRPIRIRNSRATTSPTRNTSSSWPSRRRSGSPR